MFIAALFIITKPWKQPRCSSIGKWINWYTQTMEYYQVLKRNEESNHEKKKHGRILNLHFLSEKSQSEKFIHCMIQNI